MGRNLDGGWRGFFRFFFRTGRKPIAGPSGGVNRELQGTRILRYELQFFSDPRGVGNAALHLDKLSVEQHG